MGDFVELRALTTSLAKSFLGKSTYPELAERSRAINDAPQDQYAAHVPGDLGEVAPHFDGEYSTLRSQWNNITISGAKLQSIEDELEAILALSEARVVVHYRFDTEDRPNFLDELFACDMMQENSFDADALQWNRSEEGKLEQWPMYAVASIVGFAIAMEDTMSGNDGTAASLFGMAALGGFAYCYFAHRELQKLRGQILEIERKWNGPPGRKKKLVEIGNRAFGTRIRM